MITEQTTDNVKKAVAATKTAAQSVVHDGQMAAHDLADSVKEQAQDASETIKHKASALVDDVKDKAKDVAAGAREMAGQKAEAAKDTLADEGHRFAGTLRSAASDHGETVQGRVLDVMAGGVESVADSIRGRSFGSLFSDLQAFARRNPGAFVAGAAVAGFALARFVNSGAPQTAAKRQLPERRS